MAERWLVDKESEIGRGEWRAPATGKTTLAEWITTRWRRDNVRDSTRMRDVGYVNRYIVPALGNYYLNDLDTKTVQAWLDDLASRLAPATVKKAQQLLNQIVSLAINDGILKTLPWTHLSIPRIQHQEAKFLKQSQVKLLSDVIDRRYRALVIVGAYCGLRIGELAGLRWSDIKLDKKVLSVVNNAVEAEGVITIGPPKTPAGQRSLGLPDIVVSALKEHKAIWKPDRDDAWVFPSPEGGVLRGASFRQRIWQPATKKAGLDGLRIHELRHTAVALWIDAGANALEVSRRVGHTQVNFTLNRYGHLFPTSDADLVKRMNSVIQQEQEQDKNYE